MQLSQSEGNVFLPFYSAVFIWYLCVDVSFGNMMCVVFSCVFLACITDHGFAVSYGCIVILCQVDSCIQSAIGSKFCQILLQVLLQL